MAQTAEAIVETLKQKVILRATLDPDWFCETYLNSPNDKWQSELMNAIADLDRIRLGYKTLFNHKGLNRFTVAAFHGPGKTHVLAKVGIWLGFTRKGRVPCTAPKLAQLKERLWPELRKLKASANPALASMINIRKIKIEWCGDPDWCMLAETASNSDNLAGHHHKWLAFLVEEASGIDQGMIPTIEGALSTPNAILVLIGNPTQTTGEFYDSHNKRETKKLYYQIKIKHSDCSPERVDPKWVQGMIDKYGRDSAVVRVRVFGEFVDMAEGQLISLAWLESSRNRERHGDGSHPRIRISADIADGGLNKTVITTAKHFLSFVRLQKQTTHSFKPSVAIPETADAIERVWEANKCDAKNGDDIVIDCIGVGTGVAGILLKRGYPVILYKGGETDGVNTKLYRNRRVQSYLTMRDCFSNNTVDTRPDFVEEGEWDEFDAQMCSVKNKPGLEKIEDLLTKEEMKALGIVSPDRGDSCAMQWATQEPTTLGGGAVVTIGDMEAATDVNI